LTTNYQFHEFKEDINKFKEDVTNINVSVLPKVVYVELERYHYRLYV